MGGEGGCGEKEIEREERDRKRKRLWPLFLDFLFWTHRLLLLFFTFCVLQIEFSNFEFFEFLRLLARGRVGLCVLCLFLWMFETIFLTML